MKSNLEYEHLKNAHKLIQLGKYQEAKKLVNRFNKSKGELVPTQKVELVKLLFALGDVKKALKTCGKELDYEEMLVIEPQLLSLQIELARLLYFIGARYAGKRIFARLDKVAKERNLNLEKINQYYILYTITAYRFGAYLDKAIETAKIGLQFYSENTLSFFYCFINLIDCLNGQERFEESYRLYEKYKHLASDERKKQQGTLERYLSEFYFLQKRFKQGREHAILALDYFSEMKESIEYCVTLRCLGENLCALGESEEGEKYLLDAYLSFKKYRHAPGMGARILYQLYKSSPVNLSLEMKIALMAHPCHSSYAYLMGKQHLKSHEPLSQTIVREYQSNENDCWFIDGKSCRAINYQKDGKAIFEKNSAKEIFDLYASVYRHKNFVEVLSEIKTRTLVMLIGAGDIGVNKWALIDGIYRDNDLDLSLGEDRLKQVVNEIEKKYFKITRKDNFYTLKIMKGSFYFIPMEASPIRPWKQLKLFYPEKFKRQDVEDFFSIHKATANRWLKNWIDENVLIKDESGDYRFCNSVMPRKA